MSLIFLEIIYVNFKDILIYLINFIVIIDENVKFQC